MLPSLMDMKYSCTYKASFFEISSWEEDLKSSFGLQPPPGDWNLFRARISKLQQQCQEGEFIKVIFLGRHCQAEHNLWKESYKATEAKRISADRCEPSPFMPLQIIDPQLTDLGRSQAGALSVALQREAKKGMPLPSQWFVSPLKRTSETAGIEWGWLYGKSNECDKGHGVPATVIDEIRERLHGHLCNKRGPLSELKKEFPSFTYPPDFPEEDETWKELGIRDRETEEEMIVRAGAGISRIFDLSEDSTYISITTHGKALRGMLAVLGVSDGFSKRSLQLGELNVLVIQARKVPRCERE